MSEHKRDKSGLHKEISSIFKGVPIPKNDDAEQPCEAPAPERTDYIEPKQPAPETQKPQAPKVYQATQTLPKAAPERTDYTEPKQPTPEHQKPQVPKAYQATQTLPKAAPGRTDYTEPEPPTPEPQSIPGPKAFQLAESSSEVAPGQEPEADIAESSPEAAPAQQPKANIDDVIEENISKKSAVVVTVTSQNFWQRITDKLFTPKPGVSPTKQKVMVVMVPILFIALIFVFRQVFGTTARKTEGAVENDVPSVVAVDSKSEVDWEIPTPYPTTLRDPERLGSVTFSQSEIGAGKMIKLTVKGILYTEDNPSAVVGGQIVHEGEKIRGATIVKISKDRVEFEIDGQRWSQKVRR